MNDSFEHASKVKKTGAIRPVPAAVAAQRMDSPR
jgi:hypothetical protein